MAHGFRVICRNVARTFIELCMETPYWCTVLVHQYGRRKPTKASGDHFFMKALFFTRELEYVRTNISSNTWNGYTAENQEERLFLKETVFCARTVKTRKFKLLYFQHEACYGNGNWYKDLCFVYLQPSVKKNS